MRAAPVFLAICLLSLLAFSSPPVFYDFEATEMPELERLFRNKEPWLGGDGVYSLDISRFHQNKILWFFGDTLYGRIEGGKKVWESIPNNSLALMDKENGTIEFCSYGLFKQRIENESLWGPWPFAPFIFDDRIYCFLMVIDPEVFWKENGEWLADIYLAEIQNPESDISEWRVEYIPLDFPVKYGSSYLWVAADVYVEGDTCYIYGLRQDGGLLRHLVIARTEDLRGRWEFYDGKVWGAEPCIVEGGPSDLSTEFSVDYFPPYKKYVMVYHNDQAKERVLKSSVLCRWSDSPLGPWSEPQLLYTPPEVVENENLWAYAIKAHYPHLSEDKMSIVVSYVVRSYSEEETLSSPELYVPYFVKITFASR